MSQQRVAGPFVVFVTCFSKHGHVNRVISEQVNIAWRPRNSRVGHNNSRIWVGKGFCNSEAFELDWEDMSATRCWQKTIKSGKGYYLNLPWQQPQNILLGTSTGYKLDYFKLKSSWIDIVSSSSCSVCVVLSTVIVILCFSVLQTVADSQPAFIHKVLNIPALTDVAPGHCALFQTSPVDVSYMGFLVDSEGIINCNGFMMIPFLFYWLLFWNCWAETSYWHQKDQSRGVLPTNLLFYFYNMPKFIEHNQKGPMISPRHFQMGVILSSTGIESRPWIINFIFKELSIFSDVIIIAAIFFNSSLEKSQHIYRKCCLVK